VEFEIGLCTGVLAQGHGVAAHAIEVQILGLKAQMIEHQEDSTKKRSSHFEADNRKPSKHFIAQIRL
jgi:hypothetical protein